MKRGARDGGRKNVEAGAFYWAVLSVPEGSAHGAAARRRILDNLLDTELPVPVETVQAAYWKVDETRTLACAIERDRLAELVRDDPRALGPDSLPDHLGIEQLSQGDAHLQLDVLHGEFEPRSRAIARRVRNRRLTAIIVAATVALFFGSERRRSAAIKVIEQSEARSAALAADLAPGTSQLPPSLRLAAEARRVRAVADEARGSPHPTNAWPALRAVLCSWPEGSGAVLESARSDGSTVAMTIGSSEASGIAEAVGRLAAATSMRADQPSVSAGAQGTRANVTLWQDARRAGGSP